MCCVCAEHPASCAVSVQNTWPRVLCLCRTPARVCCVWCGSLVLGSWSVWGTRVVLVNSRHSRDHAVHGKRVLPFKSEVSVSTSILLGWLATIYSFEIT